jgi:hypothetical protein
MVPKFIAFSLASKMSRRKYDRAGTPLHLPILPVNDTPDSASVRRTDAATTRRHCAAVGKRRMNSAGIAAIRFAAV